MIGLPYGQLCESRKRLILALDKRHSIVAAAPFLACPLQTDCRDVLANCVAFNPLSESEQPTLSDHAGGLNWPCPAAPILTSNWSGTGQDWPFKDHGQGLTHLKYSIWPSDECLGSLRNWWQAELGTSEPGEIASVQAYKRNGRRCQPLVNVFASPII